MTLLTHFRTSNHIVIASDSMETNGRGRHYTFSKVNKVITNKKHNIVALYGRNIISEDELQFLDVENIKGRLLQILVENDFTSTGVLFVDIDKSYLIYRFPGERKFVNIYEISFKNSYFNFPEEESVSNNYEVEEKLQFLINQPVFFNEQFYRNSSAGRIKFLFSHQKLLSDEFIKIWQSNGTEFNINIESTEEQIINLIVNFYDKIYADWKLHRDCIGGDIQIVILNQNGEIKRYSFPRDLLFLEDIWPENSTPESRRGNNESEIEPFKDDAPNYLDIDDKYFAKDLNPYDDD